MLKNQGVVFVWKLGLPAEVEHRDEGHHGAGVAVQDLENGVGWDGDLRLFVEGRVGHQRPLDLVGDGRYSKRAEVASKPLLLTSLVQHLVAFAK